MSIKKIVIGGTAAAALSIAALAGTGAAFASTPHTSTVQHLSQGTGHGAASAQQPGTVAGTESEAAGGQADADGVQVQQGDQSAPDTATSADKPGSETGVSDGPGGHADAAGSNVDHQFEGNE